MNHNKQQKEDEQLKFRKFLKISKIYGADIDLFQESDPPDIYIIDNNKKISFELTELHKNGLLAAIENQKKKIIFEVKKRLDNLLNSRFNVKTVEVKIFFDNVSITNQECDVISKQISEIVLENMQFLPTETLNSYKIYTYDKIKAVYMILINGAIFENNEIWPPTNRVIDNSGNTVAYNYIDLLEGLVARKNKNLSKYAANFEINNLIIFINRRKNNQCFEITDEILKYKFNTNFNEIFLCDLYKNEYWILNT